MNRRTFFSSATTAIFCGGALLSRFKNRRRKLRNIFKGGCLTKNEIITQEILKELENSSVEEIILQRIDDYVIIKGNNRNLPQGVIHV